MTTLIKMLVSAAALALALTAPALAQSETSPRWNGNGWYQHPAAKHPHDVVVRGSVVGRDPDPFIRSQLERGRWLHGNN
jgi:hypothetical protein